MNRSLTIMLAAALILAATLPGAHAQGYVSPEVVVSKDKARSGGKVYYLHVVQERQTLYSISKTYGVAIEEIYAANPTLKLETEGLKKNQIIKVPAKASEAASARSDASAVSTESATSAVEIPEEAPSQAPARQDGDYFIHRVKWFEDLDGIAKKYGVSKESIININGMASDKVRRRQELKIPRHPKEWEGRTAASPSEDAGSAPGSEAGDTTRRGRTIGDFLDDLFVREGDHDVSISMLIPFSSPRAGDRVSFMDFYCGSLLAARSMGEEGTNIDLHTYDVGGGAMPITYDRFSESDFAIGPVSKGDIEKAASICKESTWIVSPLDMQAETLADSIPNLIQAPTPTSVQIADMVRWIKSDLEPGDKVIVVTPKDSRSTYGDIVERKMKAAGINHSTTTLGSMASLMSSNGTNRIVLACDFTDKSTVFLIEAVRNLYMLTGSSKSNIVLYSTSKIRTYDQIEVEQLHKVNLHASVTYAVDYGSKEVSDFLLRYRAVFNAEPSRSAYSGYDLMKYFSTLAAKYGRRWPRALDKVSYSGLQSDFNLERTAGGGYINNAVRRVVYNPDYSVSLVK